MSSKYNKDVPVYDVSRQIQETVTFTEYFSEHHENSTEFQYYGCVILRLEEHAFYHPNSETMNNLGDVETQKLELVRGSKVDPKYIMQHVTEKVKQRSANKVLKKNSRTSTSNLTSSPLKPGYRARYMNVSVIPEVGNDPRIKNWSCSYIKDQDLNFLKFLDTRSFNQDTKEYESEYIGISKSLIYMSYNNEIARQPVHIEDNFLLSINILHFGRRKSWYVIPSEESEKLERKLEHYLRWSRKETLQLLRHKDLFM